MDVESKSILLHYPKLADLDENLENLDVVGIALIRKYVHGKKSNAAFYSSGMYVYYNEKNYSLSSCFYSKKSQLWQCIKNEFYDLFCTNSKTYAAVRKRMTKANGTALAAISTAAAIAISKAICVSFGAIVGAVIALVWAMFSVGKNAFCKLVDKET
ncbi:hypothetical protein ACTM2X_003005 [Vibrio parahaemolyticus]